MPFLLIFIFGGCSVNNRFDFETETGVSEDEFYDFLKDVYAKRLDTLLPARKAFYGSLAPPVKIQYENAIPTEIEPPPSDFMEADSYQLEPGMLDHLKIISKDQFLRLNHFIAENKCDQFHSEIGNYLVLLHLPWYNPKDSSLQIREVIYQCPPLYHQGAGNIIRFKKVKGIWNLEN